MSLSQKITELLVLIGELEELPRKFVKPDKFRFKIVDVSSD
jgi:hypothetical protein